jgi:hypothetical protein
LAIGTIAFSASAAATPLQFFPFIKTSPTEQMQPAPQVAPQSQDEGRDRNAGAAEASDRQLRDPVKHPAQSSSIRQTPISITCSEAVTRSGHYRRVPF